MQRRYENLRYGAAVYNEGTERSFLSYPEQPRAKTLLADSKALNVFTIPPITLTDLQSKQIVEPLPEETENIVYIFDFSQKDKWLFIDNSWAFVEGYNTEAMDTYVVFKSKNKTYIFSTIEHLRNDVAIAMKADVANSGFTLLVPCIDI